MFLECSVMKKILRLSLCVFVMILSCLNFLVPVSAKNYIRRIDLNNIHTLSDTSKWRKVELYKLLINTLSEDLSKNSNCEQVWYFPAEADLDKGYKSCEDIRKWCLEYDKNSETNQKFLTDFCENRIFNE